jgi:hypothetical protein
MYNYIEIIYGDYLFIIINNVSDSCVSIRVSLDLDTINTYFGGIENIPHPIAQGSAQHQIVTLIHHDNGLIFSDTRRPLSGRA